jgi:hypothetical protein
MDDVAAICCWILILVTGGGWYVSFLLSRRFARRLPKKANVIALHRKAKRSLLELSPLLMAMA